MSSTSPTNNEKAKFWNTPTTPRHRRVSNPDQFGFFSSEGDAMIHAPEIGDLPRDGETLHQLFREELAMLMKAFAIDPLASEHIWVLETREKVGLCRSYYFGCFRSFVQNEN
ncbi:unnamed protein product [Tuber aestivum]|uniref:Uncharacterized protein n=1 Tax=Tuber aestivum TaxID=59557 RepID=A0A292PKL0_9PEZI|nr:unnamed protein product [Tuber aestivum]